MDKETLQLAEKILYTVGIVTGFWRFVDAFFAYMHKRQKGYLTELIDQMLKISLMGLKEDIEELKHQREVDARNQLDQYQKILSELRKK